MLIKRLHWLLETKLKFRICPSKLKIFSFFNKLQLLYSETSWPTFVEIWSRHNAFIMNDLAFYRVSHIETSKVIWVWHSEILRFGYFSFNNQFLKKYYRLTSTASDRKGAKIPHDISWFYQNKIVFKISK